MTEQYKSGFTLEKRIKILEDKIIFYKNRLPEAKTLEEADKYLDTIKKIYFVLVPLKNGYCSKSKMLN